MRAFILTTGRSGSTTFIRACSHATNVTAGHETRSRLLLPDRLEYPDNHIEADNRLFFYLGMLDEKFGNEAYYVHLRRNPEEVARSLRQRWESEHSLGPGWERMALMHRSGSPEFSDRVANDVVAAMNAGIRSFLATKTRVMTVDLEECPEQFLRFWDAIGLEGDRQRASDEWVNRHNSGPPRRAAPRSRAAPRTGSTPAENVEDASSAIDHDAAAVPFAGRVSSLDRLPSQAGVRRSAGSTLRQVLLSRAALLGMGALAASTLFLGMLGLVPGWMAGVVIVLLALGVALRSVHAWIRLVTSELQLLRGATDKAGIRSRRQHSNLARRIRRLERRSRTRQGRLLEAIGGVRAGGDDRAIAARVAELTEASLRQESMQQLSQISALLNLHQTVDLRAPAPLPTRFGASPDLLNLLLEGIHETQPHLIVECGSGASSVWMGYAATLIPGCKVVALEHLPQYAEESREMVRRHGLSEVVDVRLAKLRPTEIDGEDHQWYDPDAWAELSDIGLLLVDGPPASTGHQARFPALPLFWDRLAADAWVVLDDTNRPDEQSVIQRWMQTWTSSLEMQRLDLARGAVPLPVGAKGIRPAPYAARLADPPVSMPVLAKCEQDAMSGGVRVDGRRLTRAASQRVFA